jgi:hypothetical protein
MTALHYLDFDYSEDEHGHGCFEAMAAVPAHRVAAAREDIARVLDWAFAHFPDLRAPLEEGGEWDYQLESQQEWSVPETLRYDEVTGRFSVQPGEPGEPRHVLTLSLSGSAQFCEAFRRHFGGG